MKRVLIGSALLLGVSLGSGAQAADKKTEKLFNAKCAACHGKDGKAQTEKGKKMAMREMGSAEIQKDTDEVFKKTILEGQKKDGAGGVKQEMDGFKDELKGPEVDALIAFIREFKK